MSVKEHLHQLVDDLPDTELHTAERAEEQFRRGESVILEQLKRENGL